MDARKSHYDATPAAFGNGVGVVLSERASARASTTVRWEAMDDPTTSSLQYNLTLKLGSLLSLPSRFLARIRRFDDMLSQDLENHALAATAAAAAAQGRHQQQRLTSSPERFSYEIVAMPGPLAFLTSGYAIGLLVMVSPYFMMSHT